MLAVSGQNSLLATSEHSRFARHLRAKPVSWTNAVHPSFASRGEAFVIGETRPPPARLERRNRGGPKGRHDQQPARATATHPSDHGTGFEAPPVTAVRWRGVRHHPRTDREHPHPLVPRP